MWMGEAKGGVVRKLRSDRKRDIKPVVPADLYDCIARISFVTDTPIKQVGETLLINGLSNTEVIEDLSSLFRRDYNHTNEYGDLILYHGDPSRTPIKMDNGDGDRSRLSMRFLREVHDQVRSLAYALDMTTSSTAALLIRYAFVYELGLSYIERHIRDSLDPQRMSQLQEILAFMNQYFNPENKMTISKLMGYLANEVYNKTKSIKNVLYDFLQQYSS
jgi:hypothetical protein